MQFQLPFKIKPSLDNIQHKNAVMLCGSCFTEHIGNRMLEAKMQVSMNPQGILFNPMSIAKCLNACVDKVLYDADELFQLNEIWNHWDFHSRFSNTDKALALSAMNQSINEAHDFLKAADWLIITFGSSYQYFLKEKASKNGVANCHKAPGNHFEKRMLSIAEMQEEWAFTLNKLKNFNPNLKIIFTISPVRHYRDGLVENNFSKARLFELIHHLQEKNNGLQYFPAFEIVNDVLRDYRFFEQDMVHPNQQAVQYVWDQFETTFFNQDDISLMRQIKAVLISLQHKPRFTKTAAHQRFKGLLSEQIKELKIKFPYISFDNEIKTFF